MHEIEPHYNWREYYIAEEDKFSPFYEREYSEFEFSNTIYNFYIHPQWDDIGSPTLFLKILFVDYDTGSCIIELMGEWNDAIHNDIMFLKRNVIERIQLNGITKFLLIGENILNFHGEDSDYYQEWFEEIADEGGWIVAINFRPHVLEEFKNYGLHYYLLIGDRFSNIPWRTLKPQHLLAMIDQKVIKALP